MNKTVELEWMEWGQIVDGLTCLPSYRWRPAGPVPATGYADGDILVANSVYEASSIAAFYRVIILKSREQEKV